MNSIQSRSRLSLKALSLVAAGGAMAVMGIVTVAAGAGDGTAPTSPAVVAGTATTTSPFEVNSPAAGAKVVKPTTFAGGDWPGMGSFGEDWGS